VVKYERGDSGWAIQASILTRCLHSCHHGCSIRRTLSLRAVLGRGARRRERAVSFLFLSLPVAVAPGRVSDWIALKTEMRISVRS